MCKQTALNFFIILYWSIVNDIVLVSYIQQSDSVLHIHVSILFQTLFLFSLLQNIEQNSLCYAVGPCWLSTLNIAVSNCQSQFPIYSSPLPFLPVTISFFL